MKIAIFRIVVSDSCSYETFYDENHAKCTDDVRISEWVDVTFPPRAAEEFVPEQLAVLDRAEQELRAKFEQKLQELMEQRSKLRALTWEGAQ